MTTSEATRLHERIDKLAEKVEDGFTKSGERMSELAAAVREQTAHCATCRGVVLGDESHRPISDRVTMLEERIERSSDRSNRPRKGFGHTHFVRRHASKAIFLLVGGLLSGAGEYSWKPLWRLLVKAASALTQ